MLGAISSSFQTRSEPQPMRRGIVVVGEGKVVLGLQPAVIFSCEFVEWSAFDHRRSPGQWPCSFAPKPMDTAMN